MTVGTYSMSPDSYSGGSGGGRKYTTWSPGHRSDGLNGSDSGHGWTNTVNPWTRSRVGRSVTVVTTGTYDECPNSQPSGDDDDGGRGVYGGFLGCWVGERDDDDGGCMW